MPPARIVSALAFAGLTVAALAAHAQPAAPPAPVSASPPAVAPSPAPAPAPAPIQWRVENRFRLFEDEQPVIDQANALLDSLTSRPNVKSAYGDIVALLQARPPGVTRPAIAKINLHQHTHYRLGPGRYDPSYIAPTEQKILAWWPQKMPDGSRCSWSVDGQEQVHDIPCENSAALRLPFPKGAFGYQGTLSVSSGGAVLTSLRMATSDTLILSMGDSFAAGEGSPDQPAQVDKFKVGYPYAARQPYLWWTKADAPSAPGLLPETASADWWSWECHRSLFSPHVLAALKLAANDTHSSITYVSYACAGASVLDGLLTKQVSPPGLDRLDAFGRDHPNREKPEGRATELSQLKMAVDDLCAGTPGRKAYAFDVKKISNWYRILTGPGANNTLPDIPTCTSWIRRPQVIFLTIGGNDVGFAGLGRWALSPDHLVNIGGPVGAALNPYLSGVATKIAGDDAWNGMAFVCPWQPYGTSVLSAIPFVGAQIGKDPRCDVAWSTNDGARHLIEDELPYLLQTAQQFFAQSGLLTKDAVVVQESYPAPLRDETKAICGSKSPIFTDETRMREPWLSDEAQLPPQLLRFGPVPIFIRSDAAKAVEDVAFNGGVGHKSLIGVIKSAEVAGWRIAMSPPEYLTHGVCATTPKLSDPFKLDWQFARWKPDPRPGDWANPPTAWSAYASRGRWLRTANDSLLTEAVSDASGVLLDESFAGTIHPTAEGQTAVADQLLKRILPPPYNPGP